jgi:hypothetical protein
MFHCFIDAGSIEYSIASLFLVFGTIIQPLGTLVSDHLMRGHWIPRRLSMFKGHSSLGDTYSTISGQVTGLDSTVSVESGWTFDLLDTLRSSKELDSTGSG